MKPRKTDIERQREIDELLRRAHKESLEGPERSPFWRDGAWRCELHLGDRRPRLKVFAGRTCVHEEPTVPGATATRRAHELRAIFVSRR